MICRRWTEWEVSYLREQNNVRDRKLIAKDLGRTACSVKSKAGELGLIKSNRSRRAGSFRAWTAEDLATLGAEWRKTSIADLALRLGRSEEAVRQAAYKHLDVSVEKPRPSRSTYISALQEECDAVGIALRHVLEKRRFGDLVLIRRQAWAKLEARGYSLAGIGLVSGYDHTTVSTGVHAIKRGNAALPIDTGIQATL